MKDRIVGLTGLKYSGKDSFGKFFEFMGYTPLRFAAPLKMMARTYLSYVGCSAARIEEIIEGSLKEEPIPEFGGKTCRFFMQQLGTEFGRDIMGVNFWVDALKLRINDLRKQGPVSVVVLDVRFPNEFHTIRELGGVVGRVERESQRGLSYDLHPSEQFITTMDVNFVVHNPDRADWKETLRARSVEVMNYMNEKVAYQMGGD